MKVTIHTPSMWIGVPEGTRTPNQRSRNPLRYPITLLAHIYYNVFIQSTYFVGNIV